MSQDALFGDDLVIDDYLISGPGPAGDLRDTQDRALSEAGRPRLSARAIARLLGRPEPTDEQAAVIEAPLEPALVVAGAGSGKTETMAARVVWLIANRLVSPEQVLGLTFTRKAAGELSQRVRTRLAQLARALGEESGEALPGAGDLAIDRPTIATYNAYAAGLVGDHGLRLGVEPSARLLGEAEQWQLASQVVESWADDLGTDKAVGTVTAAVVALSGALGEHLLDPADARARLDAMAEHLESIPLGEKQRKRTKDVEQLIGSVAERARLIDLVVEYRRRKRLSETLDFGDQVAFAAELARSVPAVAAAERSRFAVVLLDEYQDTSYAQVELLAGLFGDGHPVIAVGDPHQSIYGWRGASASGLARFPDRFRRDDGVAARVHYLSTSWRNDAAVLAAANVVAAPLRSEGPGTTAGRAGSGVHVPPLGLRPGAGHGQVHAHVAATMEEEAAAVAEWVAERWRPGTAPGGRVTAAVLCRARSQFTAVEVALRSAGLPVEVVGLGGLLTTPEVVDVVALLEAAHDPSRGDSLLRLLTGPRVHLGAADLHALGSWAADIAREDDPRRAGERGSGGTGPDDTGPDATGPDATGPGDVAVVEGDVVDHRSIIDALDDLPEPGRPARDGRALTPEGHARLTALADVLRGMRGLTYLSLPELVVQAERALGLDVEAVTAAALTGAGAAGAVSDRGREHLDAFRDVAASFAQSADVATLGAFLAWLGVAGAKENGLDMPVREPDPDAVQIITAHAAKGLEWDVVAVPGLVGGVFPAWDRGSRSGEKSSGWLSGLGELPYHLRGDAEDLPAFRWEAASDTKDLVALREEFKEDCGAHRLAEERRLAYVAFTRARRDLLLTGSWWGTATRPRTPSVFLEELAGAGLVSTDGWVAAPDPDAENPRDLATETAVWPAREGLAHPGSVVREGESGEADAVAEPGIDAESAVGPPEARSARAILRATAALVARESVARAQSAGGPSSDTRSPDTPLLDAEASSRTRPSSSLLTAPAGVLRDAAGHDLVEFTAMLLAERAERDEGLVEFPAHVSASGLVRLAADRDDFTLQLRRPIPTEPTVHARRGTQLHAWVEQFYRSASLLDVDDLPGAEGDDLPADADLAKLRETFLRSEWASRTPIAIEADVETPVAGVMLRCRMDAVFPDPEGEPGGVVVVDWKTGREPHDPVARAAREVQLAVYRLAWSRWTGLPLEKVSAAFCYLGSDTTVRPKRLLTEEELEALIRGDA